MRRKYFILATVVLATGLGVLVVEGFSSLVLGRSIVRNIGTPVPARIAMLDEERLKAAALTEGAYAVDIDPFVGNRFKPGFTGSILDGKVTTDETSLRKRTGPAPQEGASRLVVLGDSVAFGFGLNDDETIAARLEDFVGETMKPGTQRPVASTVACPGWSFQNARRFLLDRLDVLAPDIVLYVPTVNDLDNTYGVDESGHRWSGVDPATGAGEPPSYLTVSETIRLFFVQRTPRAPGLETFYPIVTLDITPESQRRYDALLDGIGELQRRVGARGGQVAVVLLTANVFERHLVRRFAERGLAVPVVCVFDSLGADDSLLGDPHPNARCARAVAWRLARYLIDLDWIRGGGERPLPPEDAKYAGRGFATDDAFGREFSRDVAARIAGDMVGTTIDIGDGTGWNQFYGGLGPEGIVGFAFHAGLRSGGGTKLTIRVERTRGRPGLHPVAVDVFMNRVPAGRFELADPGNGDPAFSAEIPIPVDILGAPFVDVLLRPSNWMIEKIHGISYLVAFRLRRLSMEP